MAGMSTEAAEMVEDVHREQQDDENLDDDGDWCRKAWDARNAPTQHPNDNEQNDEGNEEVCIHARLHTSAHIKNQYLSLNNGSQVEEYPRAVYITGGFSNHVFWAIARIAIVIADR